MAEDNAELGHEVEIQTLRRRQRQDDCKKLQKEINKEHKEFKQREHENLSIEDMNRELETIIHNTYKSTEELQKDYVKF